MTDEEVARGMFDAANKAPSLWDPDPFVTTSLQAVTARFTQHVTEVAKRTSTDTVCPEPAPEYMFKYYSGVTKLLLNADDSFGVVHHFSKAFEDAAAAWPAVAPKMPLQMCKMASMKLEET
eukprot:369371-Pyramimonas_sp.AAC.1